MKIYAYWETDDSLVYQTGHSDAIGLCMQVIVKPWGTIMIALELVRYDWKLTCNSLLPDLCVQVF